MGRIISLSEARSGPYWRRPEMLMILVTMAMPIAFSTWSALLNNWVITADGFDGRDIGWLHTVREIPGFLAVGIILVLMLMRESTAKRLGCKPLARILGHSVHAQPPNWFTTAPVGAIEKLLRQVGWKAGEVDLWEVNEAFAAVTMAAMRASR